MAFESGHKKTKVAGRKAGTPNKRTLELVQILKDKNYSPVAELIEMAINAKKEFNEAELPDVKVNWAKVVVQCASGLLPYTHPKRKPEEGDLKLTEQEAEQLDTETLAKLAIDLGQKTIDELKN